MMRVLLFTAVIFFLSGCNHLSVEINLHNPYEKAEYVNKWVNTFKYQEETSGDIWKTLDEFFEDGGGDCEDFAIAKCTMLKSEYSQLEILVGSSRSIGQPAHAVLYVDDKFVLDNKRDDIYPLHEFENLYRTQFVVTNCAGYEIETIKGSKVGALENVGEQ